MQWDDPGPADPDAETVRRLPTSFHRRLNVHHLLLVLSATPSPVPTPGLREGITEDQITPGLWGFIMTAFFVLATTLLIVDMVRRIRRVRYRAQVEEERQAAAAAADIEADEVRHPAEDDRHSVQDGSDTNRPGTKD
ncbi:MAG: hypothetical protein JWR71_2676 [Pseudarthrobacter sp.]|jgi:hypothetical protein|nr:hypothetical protein [Pseudarthrobacter sp.]